MTTGAWTWGTAAMTSRIIAEVGQHLVDLGFEFNAQFCKDYALGFIPRRDIKCQNLMANFGLSYYVAGHKMIRLLPRGININISNYLILIANLKALAYLEKDKAKSFRPFTVVPILLRRVIKK